MHLATCRHYLKGDKSLSRSPNRSYLGQQSSILLNDRSNISARPSYQPIKTQRRERNSFREVMEAGYVRPPTTVLKPFNLSRSNSKQSNPEEPKPKVNKSTKPPGFTKPFVIYRSDKPLTIPKEFKLCSSRKKDSSVSSRCKDETPEDILKRLRAKSSQKIVDQNNTTKEHSKLIQKFKEFSGNGINQLLNIKDKNSGYQRQALRERPKN